MLHSGARIGELIAVDWNNLSIAEKRVEIRVTYDQVDSVVPPKDRDNRTVYPTHAAVTMPEGWTAHTGAHSTGLVFSAPRSHHHLNADYLRKVVAAAMVGADVPPADAATTEAAAQLARQCTAAGWPNKDDPCNGS
jgi:integrase